MYSTEQRRVAIETFIKFDHSYADTIAELGYPSRPTLNNWWREYKATGEVPIAKIIREPRFSGEQKRKAVERARQRVISREELVPVVRRSVARRYRSVRAAPGGADFHPQVPRIQ